VPSQQLADQIGQSLAELLLVIFACFRVLSQGHLVTIGFFHFFSRFLTHSDGTQTHFKCRHSLKVGVRLAHILLDGSQRRAKTYSVPFGRVMPTSRPGLFDENVLLLDLLETLLKVIPIGQSFLVALNSSLLMSRVDASCHAKKAFGSVHEFPRKNKSIQAADAPGCLLLLTHRSSHRALDFRRGDADAVTSPDPCWSEGDSRG
jgi:hypothetical protein